LHQIEGLGGAAGHLAKSVITCLMLYPITPIGYVGGFLGLLVDKQGESVLRFRLTVGCLLRRIEGHTEAIHGKGNMRLRVVTLGRAAVHPFGHPTTTSCHASPTMDFG
jgi:hypothetical protein